MILNDQKLRTIYHVSNVVRKPIFRFPTKSKINRAVQQQKMGRGEILDLYYLCSENKGAGQLLDYMQPICTFDLCFGKLKSRFSHDTAHNGSDQILAKCVISFGAKV